MKLDSLPLIAQGLIALLISLCIQTELGAKQYHTSMTQISFHAEQEKTEIAISLLTHHMHRLRAHFQDKVEVNASPNGNLRQELRSDREFEKSFTGYLTKVFQVTDQETGRSQNWNFINIDYGIHTTEVYLEIPNRKPEDLDFRQEILFEIFSDQVNTLQVKSSARQETSQVFRAQAAPLQKDKARSQLEPSASKREGV